MWPSSDQNPIAMDDTVYDLCIVGAGFFGCAAARHASANPSLKICLIGLDEPKEIEFRHREIFSSHYDEGRVVKLLFSSPAYQKLSRESIKRFRQLERISGITFYDPVGFVNIGKKGNRLLKYLEDASFAVGTPLINLDNEDIIKRKYPFLKLADDETGLLDQSGAGLISARKMLDAEKAVAQKQGCHIVIDRVNQVYDVKNGYHRIETSIHGNIKAKRVLFTTGAFTNISKFHVLPQLETYVYKEMATLIRISDSEAARLSSMPGMIYKRDEHDIGSYILPPVLYPDGWHYLKIGSMSYDFGKGMQTAKEIKEWFLSPEVPGETKSMSKLLFQALPGLKSDGLFRKICVTCETPSGFPYIDQVSPTVTVAVAGNGWGSSIAEEVGRIAANLCLTGTWDSDVPKSLFEIIPKED